MKEGSIAYQDFNFDQPVQDRVVDIDVTDINNTDVWVQEISATGLVQCNWSVALINRNTNVDNPLLLEPIREKSRFPSPLPPNK